MIEVKELTKKYGANTAVKNLSLTVEKGHIYGFLGPNGAGKSTTMNIITGCLAATDGTVTVNGYDIYEEANRAKRCIGYLPEFPPLYNDMTPSEYLRFVARAKKVSPLKMEKEISRVMEKTGVTEVKDRLIRNLSKGYKQRVGIAQTLLGDPEFIILDEPTVGLDPLQLIGIRELIVSLKEDHGVILSSHIMGEIEAVCDSVTMICHGEVVASGTFDELEKRYGDMIRLTVKGDNICKKDVESALSPLSASYLRVTETGRSAKVIIVSKDETASDRAVALLEAAGFSEVKKEDGFDLEDLFVRLTDTGEKAPEKTTAPEKEANEASDYESRFNLEAEDVSPTDEAYDGAAEGSHPDTDSENSLACGGEENESDGEDVSATDTHEESEAKGGEAE